MSELDEVLNVVMNSKKDIISKETSEAEREELITALRAQKKKKIIQEIKEEYKQEVIEAADIEINEKLNHQKIKDIKSLMWNGFFVAFMVGLVVNQVTELLGLLKFEISESQLVPTLIFTVVLLLICLGMYLFSFVKNVLLVFNEKKGNKKRSTSTEDLS